MRKCQITYRRTFLPDAGSQLPQAATFRMLHPLTCLRTQTTPSGCASAPRRQRAWLPALGGNGSGLSTPAGKSERRWASDRPWWPERRGGQQGARLGAPQLAAPGAHLESPGQRALREAHQHRPSLAPEGSVLEPGGPARPQAAALPRLHGSAQPLPLGPAQQHGLTPARKGGAQRGALPQCHRSCQLAPPLLLLRAPLPPAVPSARESPVLQAGGSHAQHVALVAAPLGALAPGCSEAGSRGCGGWMTPAGTLVYSAGSTRAKQCSALALACLQRPRPRWRWPSAPRTQPPWRPALGGTRCAPATSAWAGRRGAWRAMRGKRECSYEAALSRAKEGLLVKRT